MRSIRIGGRPGRGPAGSTTCRCPKCGHTEPHRPGAPCSSRSCPRCGAAMRGEHCG
jgi:hypothetical protein